MSKIQTLKHLWRKDKLSILQPIFEKMNKKGYLHFLGDKAFLKIAYRLRMGRKLNLEAPKTFTEKIQWLKLYDRRPEYHRMVDKYEAKKFVASVIGEEYIIPTFGVWSGVEDIDWDALPDKFVLKTTNGSGGFDVVICKNKQAFNFEQAKQKLSASLGDKAFWYGREWPYKGIKPRIIAEEFMEERTVDGKIIDNDLADFKFFCFNGEPKFCQVIRDRHKKETIDFYDIEWNHLPFVGLNPIACNGDVPVARPLHLDTLIEISRKLSKDIPFARIDLYVINDKEYFGEITLYPASGFGIFTPEEWNNHLGDLLKLQENCVRGGGYKCFIINNVITIEGCFPKNNDLKDYKFFCFGGKVNFFKIDFGRFIEHHANYYDTQGNILPFGEKGIEPVFNHIEKLPVNINEMISIAEKLSEGKKFLRVDLYNVSGKIYFSELTFYPASGMSPFVPKEWDLTIGRMLDVLN